MYTESEEGLIDPRTIMPGKPPDPGGPPENLQVGHDHAAEIADDANQPDAPVALSSEGRAEDANQPDAPVVLTPEGKAAGKLTPTITTEFQIQQRLLDWCGELVKDRHKRLYAVDRESGNPFALRLDGKEMRSRVSNALRKSGQRATERAVNDWISEIQADAEAMAVEKDVGNRVVQLPDGTRVFALYDSANTHVYIYPGEIKLVTEGSEVLFCRSATAQAMVMPAERGDYELLKKYLNLSAKAFVLYIAWVTFTMAHAKQRGNVFVILYLIGGQGSGKTILSKITIMLVDPNVVGVERLPKQPKDLGIAAQNAHLLAYDNLRSIKPEMSDVLCGLATGMNYTTRRLYSNDEQHVIQMHSPLILNGIYSFVDQPDLAQRCLPLRMKSMDESDRKSETQMWKDFENDQPVIQRGLFDLIAQILLHLPTVEVTVPQRMYSFVQWLAALEKVHDIPAGIYQETYAEMLNEGQLDALQDSVLGNAVLEFAKKLNGKTWAGTPQELLNDLNKFMEFGHQRPPHGWPDNPIALSKRLFPMETALRSQGVVIQSERRKEREITIYTKDMKNDFY